jgi:transketolase
MSKQVSTELVQLAANTIRFLSADGVEKAKSGHPGMPMGMAELAATLWLKHLKYSPTDPKWISRDRFVLSNGHGSMMIYSLLHLAGFDVSLDDLKSFRQWESKTPGHPESFMTEGVEATTGPLGQGIGNAVGMAIGQKVMAAKYGQGDFNPINHKVWCFCGDGCLMEGVTSEASSIAGHLALDNLIIVYDDNKISIAGRTDLAFTENVEMRYQAYGFHTIKIDGHNIEEIDRAYEEAKAVIGKPVMILARTIIGKGSPNKCDSYGVHGSPLGAEEMKLTKQALNWPLEPTFYVPQEVKTVFEEKKENQKAELKLWKAEYDKWAGSNVELSKRLELQVKKDIPADLEDALVASLPTPAPISTRKLSEGLLQVASQKVDSLLGGSADLEPSTLTLIKKSTDINKSSFTGLNLRFGVREHGMGAIMNGLSYYGSFIPYGSTFLCFVDYMKPTLRLAALSHLPGLFIYTHDSIFLGEDGPTHQPIEHLQMMRAIPNVHVYRPADGLECAVCYAASLERKDGPSVLIFTRQNLEPIARSKDFVRSDIRRGAYVAYQSSSLEPELTFVATGSEVSLAIASAKMIQNIPVRVVSMPCYELFKKQSSEIKESLIPSDTKVVTVEAGTTFGWRDMVGGDSSNTLCIGIDTFGASAPDVVLAEKFGLTPELIVKKVSDHFSL